MAGHRGKTKRMAGHPGKTENPDMKNNDKKDEKKKEPEPLRKGLETLQKKAQENGGHVTVHDIVASFPGRELDEADISLIYRFADSENIRIDEYQIHDTRSVTITRDGVSRGKTEEKEQEDGTAGGEVPLTGEDEKYFTMYLEDLRGVSPCSPEETEMLVQRAAAGDESAVARLTEGHLKFVLDTARQYTGRGVLIGDLVQEGNLEMVAAVSELVSGGTPLLSGGFRDYLTKRVTRAMQALIEEQDETRQTAEKMARGSNRLLAATAELEEELGHEPGVEELARKVDMPVDDVRALVRESLNAAQYANRDEERQQEAEEAGAEDSGNAQDGGIHYEVENSGEEFFGEGYYGLDMEEDDEESGDDED